MNDEEMIGEEPPKIKIEGGMPSLVCPNCGDTRLHQGKVEVFNRGEDKDEGVYVSVGGIDKPEEVNIKTKGLDSSRNPSGRRQGLRIHFRCEICRRKDIPPLVVAQHKGNTWIYFERTR